MWLCAIYCYLAIGMVFTVYILCRVSQARGQYQEKINPISWQLTRNDWSGREQWNLFPSNLKVSRDEVIEILGKQNSLFPKGSVSHYLLYNKTKQKQVLKNALRFQRRHQATSDHLAGNSELFPVWRHSFCNVPAHGIWRKQSHC